MLPPGFLAPWPSHVGNVPCQVALQFLLIAPEVEVAGAERLLPGDRGPLWDVVPEDEPAQAANLAGLRPSALDGVERRVRVPGAPHFLGEVFRWLPEPLEPRDVVAIG